MLREVIKSKYPKSYGALKTWIREEMAKTSTNPELLEKFPFDVAAKTIIEKGPRSLYTIFDSYKIYLTLEYSGSWRFKTGDFLQETKGCTTRELCEEEGFERCFIELEKKLS
jgi:hypothetical protein